MPKAYPHPGFYEAIKDAQPLSRINGFQRTENRVRRYDKLPAYLDGFLVGGDAAIALNPIYAQGMTAAAQAVDALQRSLLEQQRENPGSLDGISARFQQTMSKSVNRLWRIATRSDWAWPITRSDRRQRRPNLILGTQTSADERGFLMACWDEAFESIHISCRGRPMCLPNALITEVLGAHTGAPLLFV